MKIHLAADIADTVIEARQKGENVDISTRAIELLARHPEASATVGQVAEVLAHELRYPDPVPS